MAGKVYFVATPIGNLDDFSPRAVRVLSEADVLYCEDTRHSRILTQHYGITTPMKSYHKFNEKAVAETLIAAVREGKNVAVISDAGTPAVSDPGCVLVQRLKAEKIPYTVVPGACAFVNAFVLSGFQPPVAFVGFLPEKTAEKRKLLEKCGSCALAVYVSPHNVNEDLAFLEEALGNRNVALVRELTKVYEEVTFGTLADRVENPKGEYVLVVEGKEEENSLNDLSVREHVEFYVNSGLSRMDAMKQTAKDRGISKSAVYKEML